MYGILNRVNYSELFLDINIIPGALTLSYLKQNKTNSNITILKQLSKCI